MKEWEKTHVLIGSSFSSLCLTVSRSCGGVLCLFNPLVSGQLPTEIMLLVRGPIGPAMQCKQERGLHAEQQRPANHMRQGSMLGALKFGEESRLIPHPQATQDVSNESWI